MRLLFWRFFLVFWATLLIAIFLVKLTLSPEQHLPFPPPHLINTSPDIAMPLPDFQNLPFWRRPLFHFAMIIISSILFSAILAKHIVTPIRQLKKALAELAQNRWQTQLGTELTGRRDEFGSVSTKFNLMASQAAEAIASQQRLLHDVSHELRSPLARMQILAGLATQSPNDTSLLRRIESEVTKIDSLVNDILTFSRLDYGNIQARFVNVDVMELVSSICDDALLEARSSNKNLWVHLNSVEEVSADPALLYSAIENAIRNAIKYTPEQTEVNVHLHQKENTILLQVCDQGPGVPASDLPHLFSPFFRSKSNHNGIGLGLSIAKRAIEVNGGSIHAENIFKQGVVSGFYVLITLPVKR